MNLFVTDKVKEKIKLKHGIDFIEVEEAFFLHNRRLLEDKREEHKTNPPTMWFISETFDGRLLKVVLIPLEDEDIAILRTAYEPSEEEINIYEKAQ